MLSSTMKLFPATLSVIVLLELATSSNALGCFSGGLVYNDVTSDANTLSNARNAACASLGGNYVQGGTSSFCAPIGNNRINFEAHNNAGTPQTLLGSDCVAAMTIEMNACSHGSQQNHGSFRFTNDPNAGGC